MSLQISTIKVFWNDHPMDEGYRYKAYNSAGRMVAEGPLWEPELDDAIREAVWELRIDLSPDSFSRKPKFKGGLAIWRC